MTKEKITDEESDYAQNQFITDIFFMVVMTRGFWGKAMLDGRKNRQEIDAFCLFSNLKNIMQS